MQVAPSGFVQWSRGGAQGLGGWLVHTVGTWLVNRLVFWGGWSVVVWQGDEIAPQRKKVMTRRYRTEQEAREAFEQLLATMSRAGPPKT